MKDAVKIKQIAHEFTHNVIESRGDYLTNNGSVEEYAIMEFFCDVFGLRVENETVNTFAANKWKMQLVNVNEFRDFSNPFNSNPIQPKVYNGTNWYNTGNLSVDGHHNSGVPAHWYYLLAEGNAQINGVGINKAFEIAKKTLFYEIKSPTLYPQKNFAALRRATLKIAKQIYGNCSAEANAVRKAWDAVGVTGGCELAVKLTTHCPSPSTCNANITICGYSGSQTALKRTWKKKVNGVYKVMSNVSGSNVTLTCGKEYQVIVEDLGSPLECYVIKNFTCETTPIGSINLPCPPSPIMTASYNVINNCNDNNITGSVSGGIPPYTYNWSNGSTSQNLMNVSSGTYSLTVSDNGCNNYQNTFSVDGFAPLNVSGQIQTLCSATDVGAITLNVSGGKTPYAYHWSNGVTSQNLSNLSVGSYAVTVTDANGCSKNLSYYVGVSSVTLQNFSTTPSCIYSNDGVINLGVYGGTAPYTYQWQGNGNSQTVQNPTGLRTGQHCVTVTDANGCVNSACYNVLAASYSYADDPLNCERIYTCNGQTYTKDMLDYANIDRDFENCVGEIPCKIQGGTPEIVQGYIPNGGYFIGGFFSDLPKCHHECEIFGVVDGNSATPDNPMTLVPIEFCDGGESIQYEVYCNGQFSGYWCDEVDIVINIWIGICHGCTIYDEPIPWGDTLTGPLARVGSNNDYPANNYPNYRTDNYQIFPNPFKDYINLVFESEFETVDIKLKNLLGQNIEQKTFRINKGTQNLRIDFNQELTNGVYVIDLEFPDGTKYSQKLIYQQ